MFVLLPGVLCAGRVVQRSCVARTAFAIAVKTLVIRMLNSFPFLARLSLVSQDPAPESAAGDHTAGRPGKPTQPGLHSRFSRGPMCQAALPEPSPADPARPR